MRKKLFKVAYFLSKVDLPSTKLIVTELFLLDSKM